MKITFRDDWRKDPQKAYDRIYKANYDPKKDSVGKNGITKIYKERLNEEKAIFLGHYSGAGIFIEFNFKPEVTNRVQCLEPRLTTIKGSPCFTTVLETVDYEKVDNIVMTFVGDRENITSAQAKLDEILETNLKDDFSFDWRS